MASQGSEEKKDTDVKNDSLLDYINSLTTNLQQTKQGFSNDSSDSNQPEEVYGYFSKTVQKYINPKELQRKSRTNSITCQFGYVASPDGAHNYLVRNISQYQAGTDPELNPLRIFKIKFSDVNLSNGTFKASKATVLDYQQLLNMTPEDHSKFPSMNGKITYDARGNLAIQPYEQVKTGNNGYRWKAHQTLLQIADAGHPWISSSQLCKGDEVQFKLMNDIKGSPFATQLHKISLIHPGTIDKNTHIQLESHKFVCSLTDIAVDTMVNYSVVEIDTYRSQSIHETLKNEVHPENSYINLIPTPSLFLTLPLSCQIDNEGKAIAPHNCITAGDIEVLMHEQRLAGRWSEIGMDMIHQLFLSKFNKDALVNMKKSGILNSNNQAHWVIHHTHDTVTNTTVSMVQADYNNNSQHTFVLSTSLITKHELKGRANKVTSQTVCEKIHTTWTDPDGYETPLQIKNSRGYKITDHAMQNHLINMQLDIHMFHDDGHLLPHTIKQIGNTLDYKTGVGQTKEFTILYMSHNENVKNVLTNLSDNSVTGKKHISVQYNTVRSLMYGKFRQANITIVSNATEEIITKLAEAGVNSIAPKVRDGYKYFKLRSKSFLQFPKQLENLQEQFKMVEIADRNLFYIYLRAEQTFEDVPHLLGMSNPSEFQSCCLSSDEVSPWTEIEKEGKAIMINKIYQEDMPEQHNTIYISGFSAIMKAGWLQQKIHNCSNVTIEIVDELDGTNISGKVTARYLQNMAYTESAVYTLALSTQNETFLSEMKDKLRNIKSHSKGKYSFITTELNRLRHSVDVIGESNEDKNDDLPGTECLYRERNATAKDNDFTEILGKKKKTKKSMSTKSTNAKQKNVGPSKPQANKYGVLTTILEEEEPETLNKRSKDDDDFTDNSKDTLITNYMKKNIWPLVKNNEDFEEKDYVTLKDNIVKLVTSSSPDYHTNSTLPTYFTSNAIKKKGVGVLMKEYFSGKGKLGDFITFTKQAMETDNNKKWQLLRTRVQAAQSVNTTNARLAERTTRASIKDNSNTVAMVTTSSKRSRTQTVDDETESSTNADDSTTTADASKKLKQTNTITDHFMTSNSATSSQVAPNN